MSWVRKHPSSFFLFGEKRFGLVASPFFAIYRKEFSCSKRLVSNKPVKYGSRVINEHNKSAWGLLIDIASFYCKEFLQTNIVILQLGPTS